MNGIFDLLPVLDGYELDPMTLGPVLPEGWTGDAWVRGEDWYRVRAWRIGEGPVLTGVGSRYEDARRSLLEQIVA